MSNQESEQFNIPFSHRINEEVVDRITTPYSLLLITNNAGKKTLIRFQSNDDLKHYLYNYIEINSIKQWSATMHGQRPQQWEVQKGD